MYTRDQNSQKYQEPLWLHTSPGPRASTWRDQNQRSGKQEQLMSYLLYIINRQMSHTLCTLASKFALKSILVDLKSL